MVVPQSFVVVHITEVFTTMVVLLSSGYISGSTYYVAIYNMVVLITSPLISTYYSSTYSGDPSCLRKRTTSLTKSGPTKGLFK
jgi:hypothetical protein